MPPSNNRPNDFFDDEGYESDKPRSRRKFYPLLCRIVQRWEVLQAQAVERQRLTGHMKELQKQVGQLRQELEEISDRTADLSRVNNLDSSNDLSAKLTNAKGLVAELKTKKEELSNVNVSVHRFLTDTGFTLNNLKDDVHDLYRIHDETNARVIGELSRLESAQATWKLWEEQAKELTMALKEDSDTLQVVNAAIKTGSLTESDTTSVQDVAKLLNERRKTQSNGIANKKLASLQFTRTQGLDIGLTGDDCLSDSGTSGYESCSSEELSERERRLHHLRRLARDLEATLHPHSQAWAAIEKTLSTAENELRGLQNQCRDLVMKTAETFEQLIPPPSPTAGRRRRPKDTKISRGNRVDRRSTASGKSGASPASSGSGKRSWLWRVILCALPFQAALLLLFCVAYLLEPNCCDRVNSRSVFGIWDNYVSGPPPT